MSTQEPRRTAALSAELLEQRHQLDDPAVDAAFRRLAIEHKAAAPAAVGPELQGVEQ